jgi:hypothetical protein
MREEETMAHSILDPLSFVVSETPEGGWKVRERRGRIERVFASRQAAIHFALFEIGDRPASALLSPRGSKLRSWY